MGINTAIIVALVFGLLGSGLYIGLSLGAVGVVGIELFRHLGSTVGAILYNSVNNFPVAAIPMFILMGQFILRSGLSTRLYQGVSKWTGVMPGGLLHSNILASAIFAAVSGSSPATAATIGTVAFPEQRGKGYSPGMVAGSLAAGGTLGILIPPSINMIIYGAYVGASVGRLFAGGILPGIILSSMFMVYIGFISLMNKSLAPEPKKLTKHYFWDAIVAWKHVFPVFSIIVLVMGSIYTGIMTPTEAAAASAFLALILGILFGQMNFPILKASVMEALRTASMLMLLFVGANLLGSALGLLRIPAQAAGFMADLGLGPMSTWFLVVIFYLILGCFMDSLAMMLVTLSVTYPLVVIVCGFDPIWFGVQLVILCEIGMLTPPVGLLLFIIKGITGESLWTIIRGVLPFFICQMLALGLFTFMPEWILFLPDRMV